MSYKLFMMLSRRRSADQLYNKQKTKLSNPFLVRFDALDKRIVKDMELAEFYASNNLEGGCGGLRTMRVTFFMGEKKFGPAEEQTKGNREIEKITGKKYIWQEWFGNWARYSRTFKLHVNETQVHDQMTHPVYM